MPDVGTGRGEKAIGGITPLQRREGRGSALAV